MRIRSKLYLTFAVALLVPSIAAGFITFEKVKSTVTQDVMQSATDSIQLLGQNIDKILTDKEKDVSILAQNIDSNSIGGKQGDESPTVRYLMNQYQQANPEVESLCVGTDKGVYMNAPSYLTNPPGYDPRVRPWYKAAMAHPNTQQINTPFVSKATGHVVVAIGQMTKDGHGVVLLSLSLKGLAKTTQQVNIGDGGYVNILDQDGNYLVSSQFKPGSKASGPEFSKIYKTTSGTINYTQNGTQQTAVYSTDPLTGWKVVATFPMKKINAVAFSVFDIILWVMVISLILGGILVFIIVRSITRRLNNVVDASGKIASGDLTQVLTIQTEDEIGTLGRSFNQMREALREVLAHVTRTAEHVATASGELTAGVEESSSAIEQVTLSVQDMASGSMQQLELVDLSTRAIGETSQAIERIATTSNHVASSAQQASSLAATGQFAIEGAMNQMGQIQVNVGNLAESVNQLGDRSKQIGKIIGGITEIASQTNLLALNAAIEASRAGEHGRGFAVVADEVRTLSEQTSAFASQIAELVRTIQSDMQTASQATENTTQAVDSGKLAVKTAEEAFANILHAIAAVANEIQEVSVGVQQISISGDEVARSMQLISEAAQTNANGTQNVAATAEEQLASMEEIASSATSLSQVAGELKEVISRFIL